MHLHLEEQGHAACHHLQQAAQSRDRMAADLQASELAQGRAADLGRGRAQPPRIGVMEHDDVVVGGQPEVALDPGAALEGERSEPSSSNIVHEVRA